MKLIYKGKYRGDVEEFESSKKDYWSLPNGCKHIASLVMETKNYLEQFPIGIHTNKEVSQLIDRYIGESIVEMSIPQTEQKVELEPRIVYDGRNYRLNFRIGHKKKYVLKDVYEFADHMAKGEEVEYGAGLSFVHHRNAFSNQSIKLIDFLCDRTKENLIMFEQFRTNYYAKIPDRRNIMITPNVMDLLFPMIQEQKIEFTDQSYNKNERKPKILSCQIQNPQINVTLVGRTNKNNEFYGADVVFENFLTIEGEHHLYIIKIRTLY